MSQAYRILSRLKFWWKAQSKYAVHAPFAFDFYTKAICAKRKFSQELNSMERLRQFVLRDSANDILCKIPSRRHAFLLYRIVAYLQPKNVLEVGNSRGLVPVFMACANKQTKIADIKKESQYIEIGDQNNIALLLFFKQIGLKVKTILPDNAKQNLPLGVVYFSNVIFDKNLYVFFLECLPFVDENSVFIFSRIHTSKLMENTWNEIIRNENISLSLDIFHFGIVFFKKNIAKQHFNLKY